MICIKICINIDKAETHQLMYFITLIFKAMLKYFIIFFNIVISSICIETFHRFRQINDDELEFQNNKKEISVYNIHCNYLLYRFFGFKYIKFIR